MDGGRQAVKQQVRQFYDQIGWQMDGTGMYQNARYEDLRPVAREYIHRCHLRVRLYLKPEGKYLLDAGSGPVQYAEYLAYSQGYQRRVCLDISIVALQEARKRLGDHGLYVVADAGALPFKAGTFEGLVSLHTLHHLPPDQQVKAYLEFLRVLAVGSSGVIVNGWTDSPMMGRSMWLVNLMERIGKGLRRKSTAGRGREGEDAPGAGAEVDNGKREDVKNPTANPGNTCRGSQPVGTFVHKLDAAWLKQELQGKVNFNIYCWRSVSVRFLRAMIHERLAGRLCLRLLFWLEERWPHFFGEQGQYPLIVIYK